MKKLLILIVLIGMQGCEKAATKPDETGDLLIRIQNATPVKMEHVYVNTSGGEGDYGTITKRSKSHYISYESAYRYTFVRFVNGKDTVRVQPIDYVGETKLRKGKYTYKITMTDKSSTYAGIELIED